MPRPDALPFDLRGLEIFLAVCDAGTMAVAARRLGLTQPAMSQSVADLERRIGVQLFDRGTRPLALAPSPQPWPAPTARALPAEPAVQRGPFWMPIRGPDPTAIDIRGTGSRSYP